MLDTRAVGLAALDLARLCLFLPVVTDYVTLGGPSLVGNEALVSNAIGEKG
jgi:hypothetical protein